MPQQGSLMHLPFPLPEHLSVHSFPPPYNEDVTPYSSVKDFSKVIRYELESKRKFKTMRPCKVIFVGNVAVGKTTMVNKFCYDKFQENYKATIGVDFEIENFNVLGQDFSLEMWDTAGQERFKCIAQSYYRNANVIVVVFDMSKPETLQSAITWLKNALAVNTIQKPLIFLVGTKSDLLSKDDFMRVENNAAEIAQGIKAEYWSVSARTGFQIVEFFQRLAALAFEVAFKQAIMDRDYFNGKLATSELMQQKSQSYDFHENIEHYDERQSSYCWCF